MVDRRYIEQLDDADPQKRKLAIQQLARSKDMAALRYLEATERGDADASVRDIARKAIVYIQRQNETAAAPPPPPPAPEQPEADADTPMSAIELHNIKIDPFEEPKPRGAGSIITEFASMPKEVPYEPHPLDPNEPMPTRRVALPEARVKAAKIAVDLAAREAFGGLTGRAAKYLVEAFQQNPNLQFDNYAVGLAETVTGLHKADAVKALMDQSALALFDKNELLGKKKIDTTELEGSDGPPARWGTAIVDLFMYGLINAIIVGAFAIVLVQVVVQALQTDPNVQAALQQQQMTFAQFSQQLISADIMTLIVMALVYGLLSIVGLLIQSTMIHVIARTLLGGEGWLPNLIHKTSLFLGIMAALIAATQIVGILMPLIADPLIGIISYGVSFLLSIYVLIGYAKRIAKAYEFGGGKGCLALFLSTVLLGVLGAAFVLLVGPALGVSFGASVVIVTPGP